MRGFLSLLLAPSDRVTRERIAEFSTMLAVTNTGMSVVTTIRHVRQALLLIQPGTDLEWLLRIARQIEAQSYTRPKRPRMVSSLELYQLGHDLMDEAEAQLEPSGRIPNRAAITYRDGLIIALLVAAPMRRTNLAALQIDRHLVRAGAVWTV